MRFPASASMEAWEVSSSALMGKTINTEYLSAHLSLSVTQSSISSILKKKLQLQPLLFT
jgi:hypothetical protein